MSALRNKILPVVTALLLFTASFPARPCVASGPESGTAVSSTAPETPAGQAGKLSPVLALCVNHLKLDLPVAPSVEDGVIMIPIRAVSEFLGLTLTWDQSTQSAVGVWMGQALELPYGKLYFRFAGQEFPLTRAISVRDGALLVPSSVLEEVFRCEVQLDEASAVVNVVLPPSPMEIWGFYALGSQDYSSWTDFFGDTYPAIALSPPADEFSGVILGWFSVRPDGTVWAEGNPSGFNRPSGWPAVLIHSRIRNVSPYAMFYANNGGEALSNLLADEVLRTSLALEVERAARGFDGVAIDFEGLGSSPEKTGEDAGNLTEFLKYLRNLLPAEKGLIVAVPPLNGHYRGYDHKAIGEIADKVVLMAYGYEEPGRMGPTSPRKQVEEAVSLETAQVPPEKILLGVPLYGTLYCQDQSGTVTLKARPALKDWPSLEQRAGNPPKWDPELGAWVLSWNEESLNVYAFVDRPSTIDSKLSLARKYRLAGVALWRLGLMGQDGWTELFKSVKGVKLAPAPVQ
ncbi:MAG TPA: hypothetical protein GX510_08320 [Firmicutes bacterium]|nr:hypothetical protein [Candidatus Fermentithermobacillaceae bacterium]